MKKTFLPAAAALLAVAGTASAAEARSGDISIRYSSGGGYYAPAPVYYQPRPVYYQPAPVYFGPAYYPRYSPHYRVHYWDGPRGRGHGHRGHWR